MPCRKPHPLLVLSALLAVALARSTQAAPGVSLEAEGICIRTADNDRFVLTYPALTDEAKKVTHPGAAKIEGNRATMSYPGGGQVSATLTGDAIRLHFTALPAEAKGLRMDMPLPVALAEGGKWQLEDGQVQPFPAKADKQFVFNCNPRPVKLWTPAGGLFTLSMPHGWQQLQDYRIWNTERFVYMLAAAMPREANDEAYYTFSITVADVATPSTAARPGSAPLAKSAAKAGLSLRLASEGVTIDAGAMGQFKLEYPVLVGQRWDDVRKPIERRVDGNTAIVRFDAGATITLALEPAGEITLTPAALPAEVKNLRMQMLVDFNYASGGSWRIGDASETPFPAAKPAKPHLYQGNAERFTLRDSLGATLAIQVPPYSFQQLTDNRQWDWKTFNWQFDVPNPGAGAMKVKVALGARPSVAKVLVDRFGQSTTASFPKKVKSESELKEDLESEAAYLAALQPPATDEFGGQPGTREKLGLTRTGFFHVEKKGDRWLLVDPEGNAFFHLGVCAFNPSDDYTYVQGREHLYEWLPSHSGEFQTVWHPNSYWNPTSLSFHLVNLIRKTGRPYASPEYTQRMIERVRRWGFNSTGAFGAGDDEIRRKLRFPHVATLPLSTWEGFPDLPGAHGAFDPFDAQIRARCDKNFAEKIAPAADDPLLVGYFLNNEPLYEDLPRALPALSGKYPCKQRLARMLEEKYTSIGDFNRAWETSLASFAEVAQRGLPVKTKAAAADVQEFTRLFLDAYFQLVCQTFRKYDKNHLLIGNRLQAGTINNRQLCQLSGKYLDVVSFNYYTYHLDKTFLNRIYQWTGGRPMILSEFYYNSPSDSGLPGGGKDVSNQRQRGLGYRNYVEQAASLGYIVGIEWFTLVDQSVTGRFFSKYNGENGNTGLISVADRPWKVMLSEMMKTNYTIGEVLFGQRHPFAFDDPRFAAGGTGRRVVKISRATGPIQLDGLAANWPGTPAETIPSTRLVQGADAGGVEASFKLCWDDRNLYLLAHVVDATPMKNDHEGPMLWSGDGIELFVGHEQLDEPGPLLYSDRQILLGAGPASEGGHWHFVRADSRPQCSMAVLGDVDGKGYTLQAALPFSALGFTPREGLEILFDIAVDDSADGKSRQRQLVWNGTARNSGDRSAWGRAVLAK